MVVYPEIFRVCVLWVGKMAVSGFKISKIPKIRVVCPDFFWIKPQILPGLFQIAPDGFGKIGKLFIVFKKTKKIAPLLSPRVQIQQVLRIRGLKLCKTTLRIPLEGSLKGLQPYNTQKTAFPNPVGGISGKPRDI
jgi:hypothetical protein